LKTGVIKPDLYDPLINKAFGEFATHYGVLIDPARALKPRDKALSSHCTSMVGLVG
jgi:transposase